MGSLTASVLDPAIGSILHENGEVGVAFSS